MNGGTSSTAKRTVVVIGAGTMGCGIATVAVLHGFRTVLVDVSPRALDAARTAVMRRVSRLTKGGETEGTTGGIGSLHTCVNVGAAVRTADIVLEAVPESEGMKMEVFGQVAAAAPSSALLATNTSTLSVTSLAKAIGGSGRVVGMHFFNPAHRMALVEIIVGQRTSEATVADAIAFTVAVGKDPIVVCDVPGFVTSRLGLLLGNEAMRLVEEGVASAPDVDKAMRLGYGHPMGPLELADLVGLDARLNNLRSMHQRTGLEPYRVPGILERLVERGHWGRKTGSGFYEYDESGQQLGPARDL